MLELGVNSQQRKETAKRTGGHRTQPTRFSLLPLPGSLSSHPTRISRATQADPATLQKLLEGPPRRHPAPALMSGGSGPLPYSMRDVGAGGAYNNAKFRHRSRLKVPHLRLPPDPSPHCFVPKIGVFFALD